MVVVLASTKSTVANLSVMIVLLDIIQLPVQRVVSCVVEALIVVVVLHLVLHVQLEDMQQQVLQAAVLVYPVNSLWLKQQHAQIVLPVNIKKCLVPPHVVVVVRVILLVVPLLLVLHV